MTALALDAPATPETGGGRVAVSYERISRFRARNVDTQITRQVARQAMDAVECAAEHNLGPLMHVTDEGISASRFATRERDGWLELLEMIRAGRVSVVLVWILDRIIRQTRDLDDLLDACRDNGTVILQTSTGTTVNPNDPDSVAMAKIAGVLAETEVAKMSKRAKRKHEQLARDGHFHGGRRRFGYEPAMHAVRESEAVYVRELADRLLKGESLHSITKDFNRREIRTVSGKAWQPVNLRAMILGAHHAGLRTHQSAIAGEAAWEPTLSRETWEAVRAVLTDPSRRVGNSTTRKYLLTGVGMCGVCGGKIRGRMAGSGANRKPAYMCETTKHVHRSVEDVDPIVADIVGEWLERKHVDTTDGEDTEVAKALTAEADARRARRAEMDRDYGLGDIDKATHHSAVAAIDARLREITEALGDLARPSAVLEGLTGEPGAAERFAGLPLARRRAVLAAMPGRVVLLPAARRGAPFDPETVDVRWDA